MSTLEPDGLGFASQLRRLVMGTSRPVPNITEPQSPRGSVRVTFPMRVMCLERCLSDSRCLHRMDCQWLWRPGPEGLRAAVAAELQPLECD